MNDGSIYLPLFERLKSSPQFPNDEWFTGTAALLIDLPLWYDEYPVEKDENGFPYLGLWLPGVTGKTQSTSVKMSFDVLLQNHLGIAFVDPTGKRFWKVTHGDVISWRLYGTPNYPRFWNAPAEVESREILSEPETMLVGHPNEAMLPPIVRDALRWAMKERLNIAEPLVGLVQRSKEGEVSRVILSLDPADLGGEEAAFKAFGMLKWYIPSCIPMIHMPASAKSSWMIRL